MKVVGWIVLGLLGLVVLFLLFLILCALPVDLNREYEDDSRFYWFLVKLNAHLGLFVGRVRVHVSGQEIVPKEVPSGEQSPVEFRSLRRLEPADR